MTNPEATSAEVEQLAKSLRNMSGAQCKGMNEMKTRLVCILLLLSDFEGLRMFKAEWKEANPFSTQFFELSLG